MKFIRSYTARELNSAEGMRFHPVSGEELAHLLFHSHGKIWSRLGRILPTGGWQEIECRREYIPHITGTKKAYLPGDDYPPHWEFDPFTGDRMNGFYSTLPNLDYFLRVNIPLSESDATLETR